MSRKYFKILLGVFLVFLFSLPVYAADLMVDEANLLSEEEESLLTEKLNNISEKYSCEVAIVTVDGLYGKSSVEYADDYYDENGYGYGDSSDGLLLLISMEDRDWWITTYGFGTYAFTDEGLGYISEQFLPLLGDEKYMDAFTEYSELCESFLKQARKGKPYDVGNMPGPKVTLLWIVLDLAGGFTIAFLIAKAKMARLKSVHENPVARDYEVPGSFVLLKNKDIMVNQFVTTRRIVRNKSTSSGGSSTHRSSSGRSHGGRGGKF